ncbi:putative potassium transport system protein kup [Labeo rohita]|uniref:Potassium transport system protein kup n=1 Tax=Labeo rohita TaxID=84645 RepID=A0ABQ8LW61_LABRO|nr:putative potassium transport system protein kup [Labeo rohita]
MGFDHNAGTAVSCACRIHFKHPKEHQAKLESYSSLLSKSFRSHGSCIHGDTFGPPAHETISVVAQSQGISSKGQSPETNKGYAPGASNPFYVVQTPVSDFGSHSRSVLS